jgi:hypothetical protein
MSISSQQTPETDWRNEQYSFTKFHFDMTFGLIVVLVLIGVGFSFLYDGEGYKTNLYTEIISTAVTILVLNRFAKEREQKFLDQQRKSDFLRRLKSPVAVVARGAAAELEEHLEWANELAGVDLSGADLSNCDLSELNLCGVNLAGANLENTFLQGTDLRGAWLVEANLRGAHLSLIDDAPWLEKTTGSETIRKRAKELGVSEESFMKMMRITPEQIDKLRASPTAIFDESTRLPDGSAWNSKTDMRRFTDPTFVDENGNPAFWESQVMHLMTWRANNSTIKRDT